MATAKQDERKGYLTIGRLVATLKPRYPELSISKVRYLEEEGLLNPERTEGGYRKFSPRDVQRLEIILRLQGEHFLPLAVIKRKLADLEIGRVPSELTGSSSSSPLTLPLGETEDVPAEEISSVTGLGPETVRELESFGLVRPRQTPEGKVFRAADVEILKVCRRLSQFGIEPRHLRMYGTFAQRESSFFQQIVLPNMRQPAGEGKENTQVSEVLAELSRGTEQLHHLLLERSIQEDFGDELS
ncbi:MAG: MerR family transcriptional regulator [Actinobacteria bacterium]|jgi:DNA-binding transcriptional MerR regulator|nr:MAG: MerR family transcriptional regulator [Actinomycetota bacterium]